MTDGLFCDNFYSYICEVMQKVSNIIASLFSRKTAALIVFAVFSVASFATLGDGKKKKRSVLLNNKTVVTPGQFSLKSGYQYRGSQLISQQKADNGITLNSLVTYQKGHMTYIVPLKTTVLSQKVKLTVGIPNNSH